MGDETLDIFKEEKKSLFPTPRQFQEDVHQMLRAGYKSGHSKQLVCSPTGSGKSYIGLRLVNEAIKKGRRAFFICHRTTLINQTSEAASAYGMDHGIIQADHWRRNGELFQIASAQTLARRKFVVPDLVVVDEAHVCLKSWTDIINNDKHNTAVVGLSATPFAKGLGNLFTNVISARTMHELTQDGILVPMRVFSCKRPDMTGAETARGEWTPEAAASREIQIVGDVVTEWLKWGENRKTVAFGATIEHCNEMVRQFNEAGVLAACYTSKTDADTRQELLEEFRDMDSPLRILASVSALATGFDVPSVSCVIDARPLRKSLSEAIQMWGRGLRIAPEVGKRDCVAADTLVRTRSGYKRICNISLEDEVWDGVDFARHSGAVRVGVREVISYCGLTATKDHEVLTNEGYKEIQEVLSDSGWVAISGTCWDEVWASRNLVEGDEWDERSPQGHDDLHGLREGATEVVCEHANEAGFGSMVLQRIRPSSGASIHLCEDAGMEAALRECELRGIPQIRRERDKVFVWERAGGGAVGRGQSRSSNGYEIAIGQDKQRWQLRAWEPAMGDSCRELEQQEGDLYAREVCGVQEIAPGSFVRGQHAQGVSRKRNDVRRNCEQKQPEVYETKGEVWDIYNCGKLQRYSANGIIAHNCLLLDFSGNAIRMWPDFEDFYYNGIASLDDGEKLDKEIRKDEKNEERACPQCGHRPFVKRCVACGHESKSLSLIQHQPGEMVEITIGREKRKAADSPEHLWAQLATYVRQSGKVETQRQRAFYLYRDIMGRSPPEDFAVGNAPVVDITPAVIGKIRSRQIAYSKGMQKGASRRA